MFRCTGREAGTSSFACTHGTYVAGTVHTKRILVHFFVIAGAVCKSSAHDATITTGVITSHLRLVYMQVLSPGRPGIWIFFLLWRKQSRRNRIKSLRARREPTTNSTHIWRRAGFERQPYWWEASALTTAPSLLPFPR